ncbi:MAG: hypothetical protein C0490_05540, partial [Marivirga sp.]|nr:hypothetical protein [Marivirga sp.]
FVSVGWGLICLFFSAFCLVYLITKTFGFRFIPQNFFFKRTTQKGSVFSRLLVTNEPQVLNL